MAANPKFVPFPCHECGRKVSLRKGKGRTREYKRGVYLNVPDDFDVPTCQHCGETYFLPESLGELESALHSEFLKWQAKHVSELVGVLRGREGATQRQIAAVCDVTPSHLSHIMSGQNAGKMTLIRFLEALVRCPAEFRRHLEGEPWDERRSHMYGMPRMRVQEGFRARSGQWAMTTADPEGASDLEVA